MNACQQNFTESIMITPLALKGSCYVGGSPQIPCYDIGCLLNQLNLLLSQGHNFIGIGLNGNITFS